MAVFAKDQQVARKASSSCVKFSSRIHKYSRFPRCSPLILNHHSIANMRLVLQPVTPKDLGRAKSIYGSETGDLVAPAHSAFWQVQDDESAKKRAEWSLQQQKEQLEHDPFVRMVKVVDAENNDEIISLGRWHEFPNGNEQVGDLEFSGLKSRDDPAAWPENFPKEAYLKFYDDALAARKEWQGNVHCWGE